MYGQISNAPTKEYLDGYRLMTGMFTHNNRVIRSVAGPLIGPYVCHVLGNLSDKAGF